MIDVEQLKDHFENDAEVFEDSRELLLERIPELRTELGEAVAAKDPKKLQSTAHSCKGMVANFFAEPLVAQLQVIEDHGRNDSLPEDVELQKLDSLLAEFTTAIKSTSM